MVAVEAYDAGVFSSAAGSEGSEYRRTDGLLLYPVPGLSRVTIRALKFTVHFSAAPNCPVWILYCTVLGVAPCPRFEVESPFVLLLKFGKKRKAERFTMVMARRLLWRHGTTDSLSFIFGYIRYFGIQQLAW
jgi:hypothetical protein